MFPPEEAQLVIRKVDSIVDMDAKKLYENYLKIDRARDKDGIVEGVGEGEGRGAPVISTRRQLRRELSWSSDDIRKKERHVNSLVEQFENSNRTTTESPPPPFRHRIPGVPVRGASAPTIPPKPSRPPRPPRPWGSTSDNPPVVPPHTPAPLIPPRPLGSKVHDRNMICVQYICPYTYTVHIDI